MLTQKELPVGSAFPLLGADFHPPSRKGILGDENRIVLQRWCRGLNSVAGAGGKGGAKF